MFFAAVTEGQSLSLSDVLFPNLSSSLLPNRLLNLTYDCKSEELYVHIDISTEVEVFPRVLSFTGLVLSLKVNMYSQPAFNTAILSGDTNLIGIPAFVAVRHRFATQSVNFRGVPTTDNTMAIHEVIRELSGSELSIPPGISVISDISFVGQKEKGSTTIAIVGKSNDNTVVLIQQISDSTTNSAAAVTAEIHNINLESLITAALDIDISHTPLFGSLEITRLGFSSATGELTTALLSQLITTSSPLLAFGNTIPKGVSAYFTTNIAATSMTGTFFNNELNFEVPKTASLLLRTLLAQYPSLSVLNTVPLIQTDLLNSLVSGFSFNPQNERLVLNLSLSKLPLIPGIIEMNSVDLKLDAAIGQSPAIEKLFLAGTWMVGSLNVTTLVTYNSTKNLYHIMATPEEVKLLNIDSLVRNLAGVSLPRALSSCSLTGIAGNVYSNANYFIVMTGNITRGKMYLFFLKDSSGVRVGITANVEEFRLSDLVNSAAGVDITNVPYFGDLLIPAMAISVTSGVIKSEALPHIFGRGSTLLNYGNTLPAGVSSKFNLGISGIRDVFGEFSNGIVTITLPQPADFSIQDLASDIPSITQAIQVLPLEIMSILNANVHSFSFNSTTNDISIELSISDLTIVEDFLSLSEVQMLYEGSFESLLMITNQLDITGTWHIVGHDINTRVVYTSASGDFSITSQSNGEDVGIADMVQRFTAKAITLPPNIASFSLVEIEGITAGENATVVLNGAVEMANLSVLFQKSSQETIGAVVVDIQQFKFADLVQLAMGTDISAIPFFGTWEIPQIKFSIVTGDMLNPIPSELTGSGSPLEMYRNVLVKGVSGRSLVQFANVSGIAVNFENNILTLKVSSRSSLSLNTALSVMPTVKEILGKIPSKLSSIFSAKIQKFSFDPNANKLTFEGSIDQVVPLVSQFISLEHVTASVSVDLGSEKRINNVTFSGTWTLGDILIDVTVSYDGSSEAIEMAGVLNSQTNVNDLVALLSKSNLPIPVNSVLSSATFSTLTGSIGGDVVLIVLSGTISDGHVYIIYQKSSGESAVALAIDKENFRLSSLVSTALEVDISSVPYFGTLIIPNIVLTVSSNHLNSPLLSAIYPPTSLLTTFGDSITAGLRATFQLTIGGTEGIVANFVNGELDLKVPDTEEFSLNTVFELLPNIKNITTITILPQALRDTANSITVESMNYKPNTAELQMSGSIDSLVIVPDLMSLHDCEYTLLGNIGRNANITLASFVGEWDIYTLTLTTEVVYDNNMFLIDAHPGINESISIIDFINELTAKEADFDIPSELDAVVMAHVIGKIENGVHSFVFVGNVGNIANISVAYKKSPNSEVVVLAADIEQFKLSDVVRIGTGIDISAVPFFGSLKIPAVSLVISSRAFSTMNLPELNLPRIPRGLLFETLPQGVKALFTLNIKKAIQVVGEYTKDVLTIKPSSSVSLSLVDFLSVIPQLRPVINSLPIMSTTIQKASITRIEYTPASNNLLISLSINSLTIVPPELLQLNNVTVIFGIRMTGRKLQTQGLKEANSMKIYDYLEEFYDEEEVKMQAVTITTLVIEGTWNFLENKIVTRVEYDTQTGEFIIEGRPHEKKLLQINDLTEYFTNAELKRPPISSLQLENIKGLSSSELTSTTVVITATFEVSTLHLVFQKTLTTSAAALAVDVQFTLVDLVETVMNVDLSSVPFINSLGTFSMAFTASTHQIHTPLLEAVFESDSPLWAYTQGIPKGVTAYVKVLIGGCMEVEVTYAGNILNFAVPQKCSVTLRNLLSEIPVINSVVNVLPSPISNVLASNLQAIQFNTTTKELSIRANLHELNFNDVLLVSNLDISLVATLISGNTGGLKTLTLKGEWILKSTRIQVSISYDKSSQELSFQATPKPSLSIATAISGLLSRSFELSLPSSLNSVKFTKIVGLKDADTFTFILGGKAGSVADVYLVYQKSVGESPHIAVAASIKSFQLADIVKGAVNLDIRNVPFFGDLRVSHIGLSFAEVAMTTPLLREVIPSNSPLRKYTNTLLKGFNANFEISLGGGSRLKGTYSDKVLSFVPAQSSIPLLSLLDVVPVIDISSTGIVSVFKNLLQTGLNRFSLDLKSKEMRIDLFLGKMSLFGSLLSLQDINVILNARFSDPIALYAEARGTVTLGRINYHINIRRNPSTTNYVLSLRTEELPIFGLGAKFLPEDLQIILGKIFDISILNATVSYPFGVEPQHLLISGMPQLFGLNTVHVTALIIEQSGGTQLVQKYTLPSFSISDLLRKAFGRSFPSKLLEEAAETSLIVSPLTLQGVSLSVPDFANIDIEEGMSIATTIGWPSDCGSDLFCRVIKVLLGGGKLTLQGTFKNARYFSIMASVSDISLGGVVLKRAGVKFVGGVEQSVSLVGSIELKSPPVTLEAAIGLTVSGIQLRGSMTGCWYNAFGSSYLTVCNLYLAMTILPVPAPVTGLEFGGRVEVGKRSCRLLTAEAYIGINAVNPAENYLYADIGPLTFQTFADAFCMSVTLPKPLADSGFPKGLQTSFSLFGKQLPHAGITIPIGFRFKGTYNILGLQSTVDINISPTRFKVSAELPPLNILGILKMYKSRTETSRGPFLNIDISIGVRNMFLLEVSGYVYVLGISAESRLLISSEKYEVFVEGRFLNLLQASLRITATYSTDIRKVGYEVEGYFKNDLFDKIAKGIRDGLKKSADEADKHISAAQDKLRQAKGKFDSAINALEGAKRKVEDAKRVFDVAIGKVEDARRRLDGVCRIRSCSSSKYT